MTRIAKSFLLLFFFSLWAAALIVTHQFARQTPAPRELYSVVGNQLSAFRAADFSRAYRNASSRVQQKFSLSQFESMIRRNFGGLTETPRVEFGFVQAQGESAILQVFFFTDDGATRAFLYTFVVEDGVWKIEGIEPMPILRSRQTGLHA
jgi:Domain of unknown function (DUF4864)